MKPILKIYGLPHTGTNVLYWLLTLNFKTYTCSKSCFNVDYLGWKHGTPMSQEDINCIKDTTNEQPLFLVTRRCYKSWSEAILNKHNNTWEFPEKFQKKPYFVFNTPMGIEVYKDIQDFYEKRTKSYEDFCLKNPDISIIIDFEDIKTKQTKIIEEIKNKFKLESCYKNPIEVKKKVNSDGLWLDNEII